MKKVMAFGTFDLLHEGHRYFLGRAKQHGDFLFVVVARDETVRQVKGRLPQHDENKRLSAVRGLEFVDDAVLGSIGGDKYEVIRKVRPDVICLGYDQKAFTGNLRKFLEEKAIKSEVVRLKPYRPREFKTSLIKDKL